MNIQDIDNDANNPAQSFSSREEHLRKILASTPAEEHPEKVLQAAWGLVNMAYEANDEFSRIRHLIEKNEIDRALKRIECIGKSGKFADIDKMFLAYVCSLADIALLNVLDKNKSKVAIERILEHLIGQLEKKGNNVFSKKSLFGLSDYLIFILAVEIKKIGVDSGILYHYYNANDHECDWLKQQGPYSDLQADVLFDSLNKYPYSASSKNKNRVLLLKTLQEQGTKHLAGKNINYYLKSYTYNSDESDKEPWKDILGESFEGAEWLKGMERAHLESPYPPLKINTLATVAKVHILNGRYPQASDFLQDARSLLPEVADDKRDEALEILSYVYCGLGEFNQAVALTREIDAPEVKGDALRDICMAVYEHNKLLKSGSKELDKKGKQAGGKSSKGSEGNSPSEKVSAGNTLESINDLLQERLQWVETMSDSGSRSSMVAEMAVLFSITGKYNKALEITASLIPSELHHKTFLDICEVMVESGHYAKATETLDELHSRVPEATGENGNSDLLKKIAVLYARSGQNPKAIESCHNISDPLERGDAMLAICENLILSNRKEEAIVLLQQVNCTAPAIIASHGKKYFYKWLLISKLVNLFYRCGEYKSAIQAFRQISDPFVKKITSVRNAQLAALDGKMEEALAFTCPLIEPTIGEDIEIDGQKELSYLAIQLASMERMEDCLYVYDLIPELDNGLPVELVRTFLSNTDLTGAMAVTGKIRHDDLLAQANAVIAAFHVRNNQPVEAKKLLLKALDLIEKASICKAGPMQEAIIEAIPALCMIDQIPEATKLIRDLAENEIPGSSFFLRLMEKLEITHLQEIISRMDENNANPMLKGALAMKLVREGLWQDAMELEEKNDLINSMGSYLAFIDLLTEKGKFDQAFILTEKIKDPFSQNNAWCLLARALARGGETDNAIHALEQFSYREDIVMNENEKHLAIAVIAYELMKKGEKDRALEFAKMVPSDFPAFCNDLDLIPFFELETDLLIHFAEKGMFQPFQLFHFDKNKEAINRFRAHSGHVITEKKGLDFALMLAEKIENQDEQKIFKQAIIDCHIRSVHKLSEVLSLVKHFIDNPELLEYILTIAAIREIFQGSLHENIPDSFRQSIHLQWAWNVVSGFKQACNNKL